MGSHLSEVWVVEIEELVMFQEANKETSWRQVMMDEIKSIQANNTSSLVKAY